MSDPDLFERAYERTCLYLQTDNGEGDRRGAGVKRSGKQRELYERHEEEIMEKDRLQKSEFLLPTYFRVGVLSVIVLMVTGFMALVFAAQSISIVCYKDAKSALPVGTVVVFDVADAPQVCMNMYYDCLSGCIGCYHDFDYVEDVCVDIQGNRFLK